MQPVGSDTPRRPLTVLRACRARTGLGLGLLLAVVASSGLLPSPAAADSGGASAVITPVDKARAVAVRKITCMSGCRSIAAARPGSTLRFQGPRLTLGKRVVYLGGPGAADDVLARLRITRQKRTKTTVVTAVVPKRAASGAVAIEVATDARSPASLLKIQLPAPPAVAVALAPLPGNGPFFPIRGTFKFGTGVAGYGGARNHQGEDVFADCGTPLVAAEGGKVLYSAFQARAGNYIVIDVNGADRDEAYMHLKAPALLKTGATVAAGQQIGQVGDTGRADGCHLHFELWQGVWQRLGGAAGAPIDPTPTLKQWATLPTTLAPVSAARPLK